MPRLTNDTDYPLDATLTGAEKFAFTEGTSIKKATLDDVSDAAARRLGIYNVLDYGAVGDGVTDDTAAIQAAIDAAEAAGGGVVRSRGDLTHVATTSLTIGSGVTFDGGGCVIHRTTITSTAITGGTIRNDDQASGNSDITIRNVTFTAASNGAHLTMKAVTRLTLEDVRVDSHQGMWATWFQNCTDVVITRYRQDSGTVSGEDGLHFTGGNNIAISDCAISSGDDCIAFTNNNADQNDLTDVTVSNCVLTSAVATLIKIHLLSGASTGRIIRDVHISGVTGASGTSARSLSIVNDKGVNGVLEQVTVDGFHFDATAGTSSALGAIYLLAANEVTVQNGSVVDPNQDGIYAEDCDNLRLRDVHVISPVRHGIVLHKANHPVVDGCQIDDPGTHGVQVGFSATGGDACEGAVITKTRVFSAASIGIFIRNATRSVVAFNRVDTCGIGLDDDNTLGLDTIWVGNDTTGCTTPNTITNVRTNFNGSTTSGKRTLGAAATDAATTQTLANNLRQALIDLGFGQT